MINGRSRCSALVLASGAALAVGTPAMADFVTPDGFGWTRGGANTTHFQWDVFSSPAGPNLPDVAAFPSPLPEGWSAPNVSDSAVGSVITSSGNIYNMPVPIQITATVPNYGLGDGADTRLLVQIRTQGTEIDPASVNVNGVAPGQTQELSRVPMGEFGAIVEVLYVFEVDGNAGAYTLEFGGALGSMSLDRLSIDTAVAEDGAGCAADWSGDGVVNSGDISAFLTSWLASVQAPDLVADFNGDGVTNSGDISSFLTAWLTAVQEGC